MGNNELQRLHFGSVIEIGMLQSFLKEEGIEGIVRDQFNEGINAGFLDGMPGNVDLYVMMKDLDKAMDLLKIFLEK